MEHTGTATGVAGLQEQLIATLLQSLVPANNLESKRKGGKDEPPALNLATLTVYILITCLIYMLTIETNFRKFSSRIGIVFKIQTVVAGIYHWHNPLETIGYGMIWSLICLQPYLVLAIPFVSALFILLVPSFLQLHPPPPSNIPLPPDLDAWSTNTGHAKEFGGTAEGRDFLLNMRDIQNSMNDYTQAYDQLSRTITDYANFADEKKSSITLFVCVLGTFVSILAASYIPVRFIALACGWICLFSGHSSFKDVVLRIRAVSRHSSEKIVQEISRKVDDEYIVPTEQPEIRLVVVYEYRNANGEPFYSGFSTIGNAGKEDDYVTNNVEAVQAPQGYAFLAGSNWTLKEDGEQMANTLKRNTLVRRVVRQIGS